MKKCKVIDSLLKWLKWARNLLLNLLSPNEGEWGVFFAKCEGCEYEYISVQPTFLADEDIPTECPNCHQMTQHSYNIEG